MSEQTFDEAHAEWLDGRMTFLTAESGWLNILGRWWIGAGDWQIGSGADADIRLPVGPEVLGRLTLRADDTGAFVPEEGAEVALDRAAGQFSWRAGRFLLEIMALGAFRGLRIRDTQSKAPAQLERPRYYPLDPALRVTAAWRALPEPLDLTIDTIIGIPLTGRATHEARFTILGQEITLLATHGTAERPMFVFRDLTSRDETYEKMRFVFGEEVGAETLVIDFNRAVNPPCAFTAHAACPLPPRENLLSLRIEAGERRLT
ncbi:DUF1684 domain-containing protein [Pararhodobacter oceanensis]|nr:DUF1684 domain-containing protein [Pararhodobacter oceanensis]